jgi:hypothetical protein
MHDRLTEVSERLPRALGVALCGVRQQGWDWRADDMRSAAVRCYCAVLTVRDVRCVDLRSLKTELHWVIGVASAGNFVPTFRDNI